MHADKILYPVKFIMHAFQKGKLLFTSHADLVVFPEFLQHLPVCESNENV